MAASKLAQLQEEYDEKFEHQPPGLRRWMFLGERMDRSILLMVKNLMFPSMFERGLVRDVPKKGVDLRSQQLQAALVNKERLEREKQEALGSTFQKWLGKMSDCGPMS